MHDLYSMDLFGGDITTSIVPNAGKTLMVHLYGSKSTELRHIDITEHILEHQILLGALDGSHSLKLQGLYPCVI